MSYKLLVSSFRLVSGGVYSSQLTVKEEAGSVQDAAGRLSFSSDGDGDAEGEENAEKADATYLTHEPRPLAVSGGAVRFSASALVPTHSQTGCLAGRALQRERERFVDFSGKVSFQTTVFALTDVQELDQGS